MSDNLIREIVQKSLKCWCYCTLRDSIFTWKHSTKSFFKYVHICCIFLAINKVLHKHLWKRYAQKRNTLTDVRERCSKHFQTFISCFSWVLTLSCAILDLYFEMFCLRKLLILFLVCCLQLWKEAQVLYISKNIFLALYCTLSWYTEYHWVSVIRPRPRHSWRW